MTGQGELCTVCGNAQVTEVNVLLASGSPIRQVARMFGLARSTVGRHAAHVAPTSKPFGLIRTGDVPLGPPDPLAEALLLAERARTPRERLRALEQVRGATRLRLRGIEDPDQEAIRLVDRNVLEAELAYRDSGDFETQARALSGWREALLQRLEAIRVPGSVSVPIVVRLCDGTSLGESAPVSMPLERYFAGVPKRFRDPDRYVVHRTVALSLTGNGTERIKVYEAANGALAWSK